MEGLGWERWWAINDRLVDGVSRLADCVCTTRRFLGGSLALGEKQKIPPITLAVLRPY
jgi:hypothetical protein